jgi:L-alanine-DL-glutamate epimerase-like enolase superfamily enzyme
VGAALAWTVGAHPPAGPPGVAVPALSAVDIAVWDLRARRAGLPLYRLLGAYRDQVPAYRSLDRVAGMDLEELVEAATGHVAEEFAAIKLFVAPARSPRSSAA